MLTRGLIEGGVSEALSIVSTSEIVTGALELAMRGVARVG